MEIRENYEAIRNFFQLWTKIFLKHFLCNTETSQQVPRVTIWNNLQELLQIDSEVYLLRKWINLFSEAMKIVPGTNVKHKIT